VQNRKVQEELPEEHSARLFGETVEQESRVPAPPQEFHNAPHLEGAAHLYALGSRTIPNLFKTGSGKDPWERLQSEERKHKGRFDLILVAIWWNEGELEHLARKYLRELPSADLYVQGTEYRMTSLDDIQKATDNARLRFRALTSLKVDEEPPDMKRRRLEVAVATEELDLEMRKLDVEERRLRLEKERFNFEQQRIASWLNEAPRAP
jgi:hypothetical protein